MPCCSKMNLSGDIYLQFSSDPCGTLQDKGLGGEEASLKETEVLLFKEANHFRAVGYLKFQSKALKRMQ